MDKKDVYNLQISADSITHNPFLYIKCGLFYYLALHPNEREIVKNIILWRKMEGICKKNDS